MSGARARRAPAIALGIAVLLLAGCGDEPAVEHRRMLVFGTVVEISLYGMDDAAATPLLDSLEERLERWHGAWHAWKPGALTRFNEQLATHGRATIPDVLAPLFDRGLPLARRTDYRFDPGIGALVRAWGFHADDLEAAGPPPEAFLERWRAQPHGAEDLHRDDDRVTTDVAGLRLDFGGVAKGIALARLRERLREAPLDAGIVNAGGDLVTVRAPAGRDWRIGIRNPWADGVLGTVAVRAGEAVFTSGDYERRVRHEGTWYHHLLDPRTGRPTRGLRAASVIHPDPALADAAATALMVAGPGEWRSLAGRLGLEHVLVAHPDGSVSATAAMRERLELRPDANVTLRPPGGE